MGRAGSDGRATLIGLLVRSDLRRRWRSWLALVALVGVVGGVSIAAIAGWKRTDTAMERFFEYNRPANALTEGAFGISDLEAIDGVEVAMGGDYFLIAPVDAQGQAHPEQLGIVSPISNDSPEQFSTFARPILVDGELPDPTDAGQVAVDEAMADLYQLEAGDPLVMQAYGMDQADQLREPGAIGHLMPTGERFGLTVTGIIRSPEDVVPRQTVPDVVYLGNAEVLLGPVFDAAHRGNDVLSLGVLPGGGSPAGNASLEMRVDLSRTTKARLTDAIHALDPEASVDFSAGDAARATEEATRSISLQANVLLALGVVVAIGGLVLISQALRRQLESDRATQRSLSALGATRPTFVGVAVLKACIVAAAGVVLAVAIATVLSPFAPVGHARRAEIAPGVDVDLAVLLPGALLMSLFVVGIAVASAWRTPDVAAGARRGVRVGGLSDRAARTRLPPSVVAGVRAASMGTGRGTVLATVFVAVVGIVGAIGFAASEQRLATDRDLWGWSFDAVVGDGNDPTIFEHAEEALAPNPMIDSYAMRVGVGDVSVTSARTSLDLSASALQDVQGTIEPRMLRGDAPQTADQIALGGASARRLGVDVGDEVEVDAGAGPQPFTVSGLSVMNLAFDEERMGEGTLLAPEGLDRLGAEPEAAFVLVDYADGVDPDTAYAALQDDFGFTVLRPVPSTDVEQLHEVRRLPLLFSLFLSVVAAATLAFVLVLTIRQRRRDLAVLRTLGFERRQLRSTVVAQSVVLVVPGTVLGIIAGVAVGRLAWSAMAQSMGAPEVQVAPVAAVVIVLAAAVALAWGVAVVPAQLASRTHPARVLRSE